MHEAKYISSLKTLIETLPFLSELRGRTFLITGANGMIGSCLIDTIMLYNECYNTDCHVIALSRNLDYASKRFKKYWGKKHFTFVAKDLSQPLLEHYSADFLVHGASTTHPLAYFNEPINTILSNVYGTENLLKLAAQNSGSRMLLLSSVEIYGQNKGDTEYFSEEYAGYIDCNTLRAGYPEAKRLSEALCQAYIKEKNVFSMVLRLPRTYGPTMKREDSKAIAQFIKNALNGEDIVLKSAGNQLFSYGYVMDVVSGILYVLLRGTQGEAYNLSDHASDISLRQLAQIIADQCSTQVVFSLPDEAELKGYSTANKAVMKSDKLKKLGWVARYTITEGIQETLDILQ